MKKKKLKLYVYSGHGRYLGSTIVVFASDSEEAQLLVSEALAANGLTRSEHDTLEEHKVENGTVLVQDGDY